MPGQVRLNLPPRLIESARAAQYANRASLDARTEDSKIQAKTVQRRQAAQRQAGLILPAGARAQVQAQQSRAVPDAPQPLDAPRIWRRYRADGVVSVLFISIIDENDNEAPTGWDRFTSIDEINLRSDLIEANKLDGFGEPVFDLFGLIDQDTALTVEEYTFVVLQPLDPGYDRLGLPVGWPLKDGTPFAYSMVVGREDLGPPVFSDYFQMINQSAALSQFDFIHLSVDNSGSMTTDTVRTSLVAFVNQLRQERIPYLVTNMLPAEEYVEAHLFLIQEP